MIDLAIKLVLGLFCLWIMLVMASHSSAMITGVVSCTIFITMFAALGGVAVRSFYMVRKMIKQ